MGVDELTGGGTSDHGNLSGLTDDDHTQYFLADGTRSVTGDITDDQGNTIFDYSGQQVPLSVLENDSLTVTAGEGLENGGTATLGGSTTVDAAERFEFDRGHATYDAGNTDAEVGRLQLQAGETLVVERIEARQKGGGSSTNFDVDVYDATAASVIGSAGLGSTTKDPGSSGSGNLVVVRYTNSTGSAVDADIRVSGYIEGA